MEQVDCVVIGAGAIGLACARALAQAGLSVVIVERERACGTGISARNSEVVHAGLYYPTGSRKAQWCVRGAQMLYDYCAQRGIAHRRCGKLLVATRTGDETTLEALRLQGWSNGVDALSWLTAAQVHQLEPALRCVAALWSPASGIVDSHGLMQAWQVDAQAAGAVLALGSVLTRAERDGEGWQVWVRATTTAPGSAGGDDGLRTRWIVNAAGLDAQSVAMSMEGFPAAAIPPRHLAKGQYVALRGRAPFSRLIYPVPVDGGLGVHLTLDLAGQARFGPDVAWIDSALPAHQLDYRVDARCVAVYAQEVRQYWPGLPDDALVPAYSGIRPKLGGPGEAAADFWVAGPAEHGCAGVVQLFGIESPGLTASMALADAVAETVLRAG